MTFYPNLFTVLVTFIYTQQKRKHSRPTSFTLVILLKFTRKWNYTMTISTLNLLEFSTVRDRDLLWSVPNLGTKRLHFLDHIHSFLYFSKDNILAIQPKRKRNCLQLMASSHYWISLWYELKPVWMKYTASLVSAVINMFPFVSTYQSVLVVQIKNWDPLVFGPALAMDRIP